ncbi:MAG: glycosyltransferase family 2 protein [Candidatus Saganbacteria bacterium]|nr:glycosyltransferase family 2 protein [Candidatus Saganbacteria bacterium]
MSATIRKAQPLLSICIPTYNRAQLLKMAVESVLAQIDGTIGDGVEIIVSDNASTDESALIVERLKQGSGATIKYFVNEKNVGSERNFLLAVERASGRYVWMLGSDDMLAPGALKVIMQEIKKSEPVDIYFCEKKDFYRTPDRPMRFRRIMKYLEAKVFDFKERQTIDEYFRRNKRLIAYCNFISNIIFKRKAWLRIEQKEKYVGTQYIHVYIFQSILWGKKPGVMKYLPLPLVMRGWGNNPPVEFGERLEVDMQIYRRIAEDVFADKKYVRLIDELVIKNDGFSWAVRAVINDRWNYCFKLFPLLWEYYWELPLFWLKIVPLLFVPGFILRILRGSYRIMVKGESLSARELLEA